MTNEETIAELIQKVAALEEQGRQIHAIGLPNAHVKYAIMDNIRILRAQLNKLTAGE